MYVMNVTQSVKSAGDFNIVSLKKLKEYQSFLSLRMKTAYITSDPFWYKGIYQWILSHDFVLWLTLSSNIVLTWKSEEKNEIEGVFYTILLLRLPFFFVPMICSFDAPHPLSPSIVKYNNVFLNFYDI